MGWDRELTNISRFVKRIRITLSLVFLICCVYIAQILLLMSGTKPELLQWLFTFESMWPPTPGWVLSGFSHGFSRPITHFGVNALGILIVGSFAEQHLRRIEYLAFFFGVGLLGSFVTATFRPSDLPTLGSSAALYGLLMYSTFHYVRNHEERMNLIIGAQSSRWWALRENAKTLVVFLVLVTIAIQTMAQLAGLIDAGDSAVASHGAGLLFGIFWEYFRAELFR